MSQVTLRDYQASAVEFLAPRQFAFIQAPAGSGKTVIGAEAVARRVRPGSKVTWIANTREQVEQACTAIGRTQGPDGVTFEVCCAAAEPDTSTTDILVFDEAHHAPAATWLKLTKDLKPSCVVWGLSATPFGEDPERNEQLRGLFREFHTIARELVEASGHLSKGKVYIHDLDTPGQFDADIDREVAAETIRRCARFRNIPRFEHERRVRWQITQEYVQKNEARNSAAVYLTRRESTAGESVLVLVFSIEHGERLAERIPSSVLVYSKLGLKKRRAAIEGFRNGENRVLLATSLADEGLDVPRASRLVLVAGGRSAGKLEQRAGRVLRPFEGKTGGIIHDFQDAGALFANAQANARFRVYERLGYDPEIVRYGAQNLQAA